jgi:hypothetical protein
MDLAQLRDAFARVAPGVVSGGPEYRLAAVIGRSYAARGRSGNCAIVIPLTAVPSAVARASFGCALIPAEKIQFEFDSKSWTQPAAILECTEQALPDAFVVLAHDVADRLAQQREPVCWNDVVVIVAEWQKLLGACERLSPEGELGLWAEIWFIAQSGDPDHLVSAWQGPTGGSVDFVLGGVGAEIKASQTRLVHSVSRTQAGAPLGDYQVYLVSYWVTLDPDRGSTLPMLVDGLLEGARNPAETLRRLLEAGYSPADRAAYSRRFLVLEEMWFAAADVPQIRIVDSGISHLRYKVTLDEMRRLEGSKAEGLHAHFGHKLVAPSGPHNA